MTLPTFTRPETETEKQDKLYNEVMILLGDWISSGDTVDDKNRRGLVIRRRCTSQPYSKNFELLMDYANERFESLNSTDSEK